MNTSQPHSHTSHTSHTSQTTRQTAQSTRGGKATLNAKHEDFVNKFKHQREKIAPNANKHLVSLEKKIKRFEDRIKANEKLTATEHTQLFKLRKEIKHMKSQLKELDDRTEENKYFLKTAHILSQYDKTQSTSKPSQTKNVKKRIPKVTSILSFMDTATNSDTVSPTPKKDKITSFFQISKNTANRAQLQDIYMQQIDDSYLSKEKYRTYENNPDKCPNPDCGAVNNIVCNFNLGRRNCQMCGIQLDLFYDSSFNSFKSTASIELTPEFPYKRENHVSEWLAKIQGKENTEIPDYVFKALELEFKKYRITKIDDYKKLKPDFVKKCLKDLGLNKYYDHKEYIIHRFNGLPPPQLSIELEETFKRMFMQIQDPFEKYCPTSRKNFLSYSYVFHKFCQLLELDELLVYFPLLKSREKLFEQDKIWKQICHELRWQYIASL